MREYKRLRNGQGQRAKILFALSSNSDHRNSYHFFSEDVLLLLGNPTSGRSFLRPAYHSRERHHLFPVGWQFASAFESDDDSAGEYTIFESLALPSTCATCRTSRTNSSSCTRGRCSPSASSSISFSSGMPIDARRVRSSRASGWRKEAQRASRSIWSRSATLICGRRRSIRLSRCRRRRRSSRCGTR
jgi:hypothetical protein